MSFLHMSLLAGLAVVTVPIMLHLFGQRQPQLVDFPALRFVRETAQEQSTSWQLRHFLLLLLRILLLAALAFALARPRVHSATLGSVLGVSAVGLLAILASLIAAVAWATKRPTSVWLTAVVIAVALWLSAGLWGYRSITVGPAVPSPDQSAPVAAVLIIDNGPTMDYRADNAVRLDVAKETGVWILEQLPPESRVGVLTGAPVGSLALDPATAEMQVKLIQTRGAHIDLPTRIKIAMDLVLADELERKEIYLITDLMQASWASVQPGLKELLEEYQDEVLVQIIDIGADDKANWLVGDPKLDAESVSAGGDVTLEVDVQRAETAPATSAVTVELLQEAIDPRLPIFRNGKLQTAPFSVVDRQVVDLGDRGSQSVSLTARNLSAGVHHFVIRLDKADPLAIDNERYVTIAARPRHPTLIVADDARLGRILKLIADPSEGDPQNRLAEQVRYAQLGQVEMDQFSVICLYDPPPLPGGDVEKLRQHVEGGGGLLHILGPGLGTLEKVRGNPLLTLLPGELGPIAERPRDDRSVILSPIALSHPVFHMLGDVMDQVPWQNYAVFRSWTFVSLDENAQTVVGLSDGSGPILLSQQVGRGQVMTLCTPVPQIDANDGTLWNELWVGDEYWPAFALLSGALQFLSGANQPGLNYQVGLPVSLDNDPQIWPTRYSLFLPDGRSSSVEAADGTVQVGDFEQAGIYRLRGLRGDPVVRGFSINVPTADTQLERLAMEQLDDQLGPGNYRVAKERDEVESSVGQARFGRELYPLLMIFVAGLFLAEQAMSNRFYQLKFGRSRRT